MPGAVFVSFTTALAKAIVAYRTSTGTTGGPQLTPQSITLPGSDYDTFAKQWASGHAGPPESPIVFDGVTILRGT